MGPRPESSTLYRFAFPLPDTFRFAHEPLDWAPGGRFIGREEQQRALLDRMLYSDGGAFLITGYRGVGKTSFVNQVLGAFTQSRAGTKLVPIRLNVARPVSPAELMFLMIRCLYLQLSESGLQREIDPAVLNDLRLAYNRTLMTLKETRSASSEITLTPEVDTAILGLNAKLGKLLGYKRARSQGSEASYIAYEERAAEYDLIQISRRLRGAWIGRPTLWQRLLRRPAQKAGDLRVVFVFDELDKIDDPTVLDALFSALKNVFTTSGLTFLFIAGKDVQERWGQETGRGESIYESVFAYEIYLPCLWSEARALCNWASHADPETPELNTILQAVSFHGRGIPRRILRNLHTFVRWQGERPVVALTPYEYRDAEFYAKIETVLEQILLRSSDGKRAGPDYDKRALGLYYLVDWILQRGSREFTLADAIAAYETLNTKIVFSGMAGHIESLLLELLQRDYIELTDRVENKQIVRAGDPPAPHYRLTRPSVFAAHSADEVPVKFGEFLGLNLIAKGGIGTVVRAVDRSSNVNVAVKYVKDPSETVRAIFAAEAEALNAISHDSVPGFRGAELKGDLVWIAMDLVDAPPLNRVLSRRRRLPVGAAVQTALEIARICGDLHKLGYIYGDLKPSNVLTLPSGKAVLIDFSTAHPVHAPAPPYGVVGTPAYMAPELLRGEQSTERSDVYALGVLLYELLCGRTPYVVETREQLAQRIASQTFRRPSQYGALNPDLEALILACLQPDPAKRPENMNQVHETLTALELAEIDALKRELADVDTSPDRSFESVITELGPPPPKAAPAPPPVPPRAATAGAGWGVPPPPPPGSSSPTWPPAPPQPSPSPTVVPAPATPSITVIPPPAMPRSEAPGEFTRMYQPPAAPYDSKAPPPPASPSAATPIPEPEPGLEEIPVIVVTNRENGFRASYHLRASRNRIGRAVDAEVPVPDDPAFSRLHATVALEHGEYRLTDAGSLNGTTVNGRRLPSRGSAVLHFGDRIEIGNRILTFSRPSSETLLA